MAGRPMPFRNPAGHAGLRQNLTSLVASLTQFFQSRLQLAARESKAAVAHLVILVACGVAAAVLLLFGYVFLLVFAIVGIAHLVRDFLDLDGAHPGAAPFHRARLSVSSSPAGRSKHPMFRDTATVLKEDTEWLKNLDQTKRP